MELLCTFDFIDDSDNGLHNHGQNKRTCGVSQILDEDEGFMIWKKTAHSNCKCSRYISYFIK